MCCASFCGADFAVDEEVDEPGCHRGPFGWAVTEAFDELEEHRRRRDRGDEVDQIAAPVSGDHIGQRGVDRLTGRLGPAGAELTTARTRVLDPDRSDVLREGGPDVLEVDAEGVEADHPVADHLLRPRREPLVGAGEQRVLVGEVAVERADGHAGPGGDVGHRNGERAVVIEQFEERFEDDPPGVVAMGRAQIDDLGGLSGHDTIHATMSWIVSRGSWRASGHSVGVASRAQHRARAGVEQRLPLDARHAVDHDVLDADRTAVHPTGTAGRSKRIATGPGPMVAGSNTTMSAASPSARRPRSRRPYSAAGAP